MLLLKKYSKQMRQNIHSQFSRQLQIFHQSRLRKTIAPGLHKFLYRRYVRIVKTGRIKSAHLFFGDTMQVVLPEIVSEVLYTYGFFDDVVTFMMLEAVQAGDTVLDIGAHFGYFTLLCSRLSGESGNVLAFEPTPSTYEILKCNTQGRDNIRTFNLAAGKEDCRQDMLDFGIQYCAWNTLSGEARMPGLSEESPVRHVEVEIVKLDPFLERLNVIPDFIKIDAESFEADVIEGLESSLQKKSAKVLMETGTPSSLRAAKFLTDIGLRPYVCENSGELRLYLWSGDLETVNLQFKDILFLP